MKYLWIALAAGGLVAGCGVENKTENPQQVAESAAPSVMLNTQVSAPVAKALAGIQTYEDDFRAGGSAALLDPTNTNVNEMAKSYQDKYKLNLKARMAPGGARGHLIGEGPQPEKDRKSDLQLSN